MWPLDITISNYRCFKDPVTLTVEDGFTALVGVNNAGKSTLLRFFYEFRNLFNILSHPNELLRLLQNQQHSIDILGVSSPAEIFCTFRNGPVDIVFLIGDRRLLVRFTENNSFSTSFLGAGLDKNKWSLGGDGSSLTNAGDFIADVKPFFDAMLALSQCIYVGPFRNALNEGAKESYFDIPVGRAFIRAWRRYKTGNSKPDNERCAQITEDIAHLFGYRRLDINASDDDLTCQLLVDGKSFRLFEVGSGLTQFIVVLGSVAMKRHSFVLIDEPELNLHPSLQMDFLTTLCSYAEQGVIFATHSYGLARASATRLLAVTKGASPTGSSISRIEKLPALGLFLGELSYAGYRELGFDRVLLVEGVYDIKTVQHFMRLYGKDHVIVTLPLGGDALIDGNRQQELDEFVRLTRKPSKVYILIDSEREALGDPLKPRRQDFVNACHSLGMTCHVTQRRAIENYFTDIAVKSVFSHGAALAAFDDPKQLVGGKKNAWRIARMMKKADIENTDVGQFLNGI